MPRPDETRILIVEDDAGTAALQRRALERAGYHAVSADSAQKALEALRSGPVHLVLLDNRLQGNVTGIDFLTTLRAIAPEVPVIMVTGSELQGTVIRALRGGARDFIRKDIDYLDQLPRAVERVLQDAGLEKQLQSGGAPVSLSALLVRNESDGGPERDALEGLGFRVFSAGNIPDALLAMGEQEIDLVVIHAGAPPSGGVEAYSRIKDSGHPARGILIGARADEKLLVDALRAGFLDIVVAGDSHADALRAALQRAAERLRTDARLKESRERLAGIVNSAMDAILLADDRGAVVLFNPAAEQLFEFSAAEAQGQRVAGFIPALGDEDFGNGAQASAARHIETRGVRRSSGDVELEVAVAPMLVNSRRYLTVIARDITQRKEMERHLLQKDKLESLGLLAGGIAHDFNNLLVGILGNSSLALETVSTNNPARPMLKDVMTAAETAANLTRQLLAYAGKGRFIVEPVDVSDLVRQIGSLLQTTIPKTVQLRLELKDRLPCIEADITQIQQVLMNLVMNAAEAIGGEEQGSVLITTAVQHVDEDYVATVLVPAQIQPGDYVCVEVHDTGCGMSQETLDRIFDPFFTTKFTGRGLGLAAVLGIVRGHRGAIKVYSTPGQGTTFKLLFPATSQQAGATPKQIDLQPASRGETVMVVDDELIVRRSAKAMLERYAYSVVLAENGKEAVDLFRVLSGKIDVVLLDMTMPVMGGEETFRQLKTIRPDVRVILSSGYNEVEAVRRFAGKGLAGFLQKPYSVVALVNKVRSVLGEARGVAQS